MTIITYSVAKMNDINKSKSSDKIHFLEKDMLGQKLSEKNLSSISLNYW